MPQALPFLDARHRPPAAVLRAAALALLVLACAVPLHGGAWDRAAFLAVNAWGPAAAPAWSALSVAGLGTAVLLFAAAAGPRRPRALAALIVAVVGGGLLVQSLKSGFAFGRPLALLGPEAMQVIGIELRSRSMPSGHAAMAFSAAALLLAGPLRDRGPAWRALVLAAALAVALSRIAVGAHWPSDVLAGAAVGWAIGLVIGGTARGQALVDDIAVGLSGRVGAHLTAAAIVAAAAGFWVAEREYPRAAWMHAVVALIGLAAALRWWRAHPGPRAP